jgi:hypothetical protein
MVRKRVIIIARTITLIFFITVCLNVSISEKDLLKTAAGLT